MAFKLEENENVVLVARRHWFKPMLETLALLFSLLIPVIISSMAYAVPESIFAETNLGALSMILILCWLFVVWTAGFVIWTNLYLDILVITDKHIIDIEQIGLWNREISTLDLDKVQDISSRADGIIESMLVFGDLDIQTAGSNTNFIVKGIEQPDMIRQKINEQISLGQATQN